MKGYVKGKPFIQNGLGAHLCQVAPYEMVICTGLKAIHFVQAIPRGMKNNDSDSPSTVAIASAVKIMAATINGQT